MTAPLIGLAIALAVLPLCAVGYRATLHRWPPIGAYLVWSLGGLAGVLITLWIV